MISLLFALCFLTFEQGESPLASLSLLVALALRGTGDTAAPAPV